MDKLKIIIAGPGAGKTYNLKNEVIECLPKLDRHRFCVVITYTNAATEELRQRISKDIHIPPNVFIGTIHRFLIRFIIELYGHLVGVPIERTYVESPLINYKIKNPYAEKNIRQKKAEELVQKGIISYDKVIEISKNILDVHVNISNILGNRLQYIFIDEYQDSRVYIHNIFEKICSFGNTNTIIIGDPLQAVYRFTYQNSLIRGETKSEPESFSDTPMMSYYSMFRSGIDKILINNYRSSQHIVELTNKYILKNELKQKNKNDNDIPVYFINKTEPSEIYKIYKQLKMNHDIDKKHNDNPSKSLKLFLKELILTKEWIDKEKSKKPKLKKFHEIINCDVIRLEKGNYRINSILQEISRCIFAITGIKKKDFIKSQFDELEYRKFCFEIVRHLNSKKINNYEHRINSIRKSFREKFKLELDDNGKRIDIEKSLNELSKATSLTLSQIQESCYSSIHSAKGLEATSVLAVAYSDNELNKWIDFIQANENSDDDFRLGYVAFSRARDMLCIACLEKISPETVDKLHKLKIEVYSNEKACGGQKKLFDF